MLGGIKLTGFDRLKVTLKIVSGSNVHAAFRHNLDLYNSIQAEHLIEKSAEALDLPAADIAKVVSRLINALEGYRSERLEAMKPKQAEKKQLTDAERKAALQYLKAPDLLGRTRQAIIKLGETYTFQLLQTNIIRIAKDKNMLINLSSFDIGNNHFLDDGELPYIALDMFKCKIYQTKKSQ